jgi:hypothetical protein
MIENSIDEIYELARSYYSLGDYSASLALCTFCLSKFEVLERFEIHRPLILLSANLYRSGLPKSAYLRPFAIALIGNSGIRIHLKLRMFKHTVKSLSILEIIVIVPLLLRIIFLETLGIFPKSKEVIYRRVRKLFSGFVLQ